MPSAATTPRRTCCTRRCAGAGDHVEQAGSFVARPAALRLHPLRRRHRRRDRRDRAAGQRRGARQRQRRRFETSKAEARGVGADRLLRREVRRHRARARGRPRSSCAAVRTSLPPATSGCSRWSARVDRLQPAAHRSDHWRRVRRSAAARRVRALAEARRTGRHHRRRGRPACSAGWTRSSRSRPSSSSSRSRLARQAAGSRRRPATGDRPPGRRARARDLRDLAIAIRQQPGVHRVVLMGATPSGGASLVAAVQPSGGSGLPT